MGVEPFMVSGALLGCGAALGKARLCSVSHANPRNWLDLAYQVPKTAVASIKPNPATRRNSRSQSQRPTLLECMVLATKGVVAYEVMRMTERLQNLYGRGTHGAHQRSGC